MLIVVALAVAAAAGSVIWYHGDHPHSVRAVVSAPGVVRAEFAAGDLVRLGPGRRAIVSLAGRKVTGRVVSVAEAAEIHLDERAGREGESVTVTIDLTIPPGQEWGR